MPARNAWGMGWIVVSDETGTNSPLFFNAPDMKRFLDANPETQGEPVMVSFGLTIEEKPDTPRWVAVVATLEEPETEEVSDGDNGNDLTEEDLDKVAEELLAEKVLAELKVPDEKVAEAAEAVEKLAEPAKPAVKRGRPAAKKVADDADD